MPIAASPAPPADPVEVRPPAPRSALAKALPFVLLALGLLGGSAYWWFNRPGPALKAEDVGIYAFMENGKWGLVDVESNTVAQPAWDTVQGSHVRGLSNLFSEGLLPVRKDANWGYLDLKGQVAIPPQFAYANPFTEGLAMVALETQGKRLFGYINKSGKYVINPQFSAAAPFHEGLAKVRQDGLFGYIDRSGTFVIKPQFQPAVSDSTAIAYAASFADGFSEGLAPEFSNGSWGYIRRDGTFQIKPQFQVATIFSEGRACVRLGDKFGFIDTSGNFAINPQFDSALPFMDGMAIVSVGSKFGTVDRNGTFLINPGQYQARPASLKYLQVVTERGTGLMTRRGNWLLEPVSVISEFVNVYEKAFALILKTDRSPAEFALVSTAGKILSGKYKGLTLATVSEQMAREQKAADEKESLTKVDQAKALFAQGQYQPALGECEKALQLMPDNEGAKALKAQIEQTLAILGGK